MIDGIGRIFGGNSYGVGGYVPQRKGEEAPQNAAAQAPVVNYEETQVDPSKVMAFLESNNIFVAPQSRELLQQVLTLKLKIELRGYMEQFEMIYGIVQEEFGEENAPMVMDFVMDSLMGMVA